MHITNGKIVKNHHKSRSNPEKSNMFSVVFFSVLFLFLDNFSNLFFVKIQTFLRKHTGCSSTLYTNVYVSN